jgi:peptidoglycan L-alanyl-D-glutamate endopeptidase CwlK
MAVDIMPYKKGTNAFSGQEKDNRRFYFLMGIIKSVTERLYQEKEITHKVRFGIDWDMDDIYNDQSFDDMPHIELEERY